ncbi:MAG: hypothetical protein HQL86_03940 [Magnetococcales bacterium]|nr:hypothetical protein [Magnetococcales bacterium]
MFKNALVGMMMLVVAVLAGCATPIIADLSGSDYNLSRKINSNIKLSKVNVRNLAPETKFSTTNPGSQTHFAIRTETQFRKTLEDDIKRYFDQAVQIDTLANKSLTITIKSADNYFVWEGNSQVPLIALLSVGSDVDYIISLKILFEIEENNKVVNSYYYDDIVTIKGKGAVNSDIKEAYQKLVAEYRAKFFSDIETMFLKRYF